MSAANYQEIATAWYMCTCVCALSMTRAQLCNHAEYANFGQVTVQWIWPSMRVLGRVPLINELNITIPL